MATLKRTILHAIDTTGPGGAETVFLDIAQKLQLTDFENFAVIKGSGWVEDQLKLRSIRYHIIKPHGLLSIPYYYELFKLIRHEKVALIHSHLLGSTLTYSIISLITKLPLIATLHGRVDINPKEKFVFIKQMIMQLGVNRLIAVSKDLSSYIEKRKLFSREAIDVIYNGVDENRYHPSTSRKLKDQLGIPKDAILIGSLGNVRPAKSYETLISAVSLLKNRQLHFVVAGHKKKELMDQLEAQMRTLDVEGQVHFIGFYDNTPDFLAQLDIFVLSSSSEGFSIATIEAMAAGLPVIATRCGGPEEILEHEKTGYLIAAQNPKELAAAINLLASDNLLAAKLADAGKEHMRNTFSLTTMLDSYRQHYKQLLSKNSNA